jgi:serine O-acetyltransferase
MIFKGVLKIFGGYFGLRQKVLHSNGILKLWYKLLLKGVEQEYGAYLPVKNSIKGPIHFPHGPHGIFISTGCTIGINCIIYQHVTIGSNMLSDSKGMGFPTIGDNCYIGAGAKIIGNVIIGNNCRIGANCVVVTDVPDNSVVVSPKAIIIAKKEINNKNYVMSSNGLGYYSEGKFIVENNPEVLAKFNSIKK